ncbi:putative Fe2OG dioxygenase domain-containing protein [Seiridium unicorne]|uniref:Fe2OG dioxygenase domain-containing protein n=1 Tax=Seiridium unicorne TaxID=138068 RepID=A0ABR2UEF1_9PEZI
MKNALVMNVGDLLMRWSNDYLKSTLHRVTMPPIADAGTGANGAREQPSGDVTRARYSIPYFVSPNPTAVIECLPQCASEDNPPRYEPITQDEYRRMRAKSQY